MKKIILLTFAALLLTGCAAKNIPLQKTFWQEHAKQVKVSVTRIPQSGFYQTGQEGLLDILINDAVTNKFRMFIKSRPATEFYAIGPKFTKSLNKHGIKASLTKVKINDKRFPKFKPTDDGKNYAKRDYRSLARRLNTDRLVRLHIMSVGAQRNYYGFIPLGAPQAFCNARGELIDLRTNKILWRFTTNRVEEINGEWSTPPKFRAYERAFKTAVTQAENSLYQNFFYQVS